MVVLSVLRERERLSFKRIIQSEQHLLLIGIEIPIRKIFCLEMFLNLMVPLNNSKLI